MSITNLQHTIRYNGTELTGTLKPLGKDVTLQQAFQLVNTHPDGYDSIGVRVDGKDYLILTDEAEKVTLHDQLVIDGKRASIAFIETEEQEPVGRMERVKGGIVGGVMGSMGGGLVGFVASEFAESLLPAVGGVMVGMIGGAIFGAISPRTLFEEPLPQPKNDKITDSLTDHALIP